jgi:hypothetical protein
MKRFSLILIIMLLLSGCAFGTVEDMLSPPRLTDEQQAIYTALVDSKGTGFKLKYPRTGEYRSAFVVYGENEDAAIVFYEISGINIERSLVMNFLYKIDGKWESLYEIPIRGVDVESVIFASFGEDEEDNIILSYAVGQSEKRCMIISNISTRPVNQYEGAYSFLQVDYFFGRDYKELLIIENVRSMHSAAATFYTYQEGQLYRAAEFALDPGAGEYLGLTQGYSSEGVPAVFINHRKLDASDSYGTDVLFFRGRRRINPVVSNGDNSERVLRKTGNITELANPRDIDGDGIIELPSSAGEFPGYAHLPAPEKLRPVVWRTLAGENLVDKYYSFYTERYDFVFMLPGRWQGAVTVAADLENNIISFYRAGPPIEEADELLLAIRILSEGEQEPQRYREWVLFRRGAENNLRYFISVPDPGNTLSLTAEELENAFRILSEIRYVEQ